MRKIGKIGIAAGLLTVLLTGAFWILPVKGAVHQPDPKQGNSGQFPGGSSQSLDSSGHPQTSALTEGTQKPGISDQPPVSAKPWKGEGVQIHFLAVGQAEAIFIDSGDTEVLIDGGLEESADHIIDSIKPLVDGHLEVVIATHAHNDHLGGLPKIMDAFSIDRIIDNGRHSDLESYVNYRRALQEETGEGAEYQTASEKERLDLGNGAVLKLISLVRRPEDPNESSLVCQLSCGSVEVLLMSDLDTVVERSNLKQFSDVDVLKVGHHGSRTATSDEFLEIVKPEAAVITAGENNRFGLPNRETLRKLLAQGTAVYGTFRSGDITLTIPKDEDGLNPPYWFDTDRKLTLFDGGAKKIPGQAGRGIPGILSGDSENLRLQKPHGPDSLLENPIEPNLLSDEPPVVDPREAVYVGNRKTKRFHTIACPEGARIADRHAVYFRSRADAVAAGYHPCSFCRP